MVGLTSVTGARFTLKDEFLIFSWLKAGIVEPKQKAKNGFFSVHSRERLQEWNRPKCLASSHVFWTIKLAALQSYFKDVSCLKPAAHSAWEDVDDYLPINKGKTSGGLTWKGNLALGERNLQGSEKRLERKPGDGDLRHKMGWKESKQSTVGRYHWRFSFWERSALLWVKDWSCLSHGDKHAACYAGKCQIWVRAGKTLYCEILTVLWSAWFSKEEKKKK